jgi:hypothetical protein
MRVPALRPEWVPIPFIIDTGASRSFIHALDAMRKFELPPAALDSRSWPDAMQIGGVGGEIRARPLAAQYAFAHDDGSTFEVIDAEVLLGDIGTQGLPSLLGCDLLANFELRIRLQTITLDRVVP